MSLTPGVRFGPYEVSTQLGVGGMGEVYRATDTRLKRQCALKILPAPVASNPDRLARFQREAEVLASLNHPNIAAIHGLEESGGIKALVMELVEGPTLADRIAQGAIPVDEALLIATQIADALEAAHARGVVHRDLKPANIKVRPDGTVKVLDFGLAKALEPATTPDSHTAQLPTVTSPALYTGIGVILGTAAYMSPEQARGKPVDKRADIWAFGCVLFEMVAGARPFGGREVSDVLADVLTREPDWSGLPASLPHLVRRVIVRCLMKDVRHRLHDIADARLDLQEAMVSPPGADAAPHTEAAGGRVGWWSPALSAAAALAIGLVAGSMVWRQQPVAVQVARASLDVAPAQEIGTASMLNMLPAGSRTALAWSPDGRTLAFVGSRAGTRQIFLRDLASGEAQPLEGTQDARVLTYSPDGQWIAFGTNGEIRKVRVSGGPAARISAAIEANGLAWGSTRIVYTTRTQLFEVSPVGGEPQALSEPGVRRSSPFLLPAENALLYTEYGKTWTSGDERVMIRPLKAGATAAVFLPGAADARYLRSGHLAFLRQGTLFVVPFDADKLELRGDPVAVLSDVAQAVASWTGSDLTLAGQLAVSPQGTLAYVVASPTVVLPTSELVTVNRKGDVTTLGAPLGAYRERVEASPDGSKLAVSVQTTTDVRLFIYDLVRGTLAPALAQPTHREAVRPAWSSTGTIAVQILGGVQPAGQIAMFSVSAAVPVEYVTPATAFFPSAWSPKGDALIGTQGQDLWVYAPAGSKWTQVTTSPDSERFAAWSPDGEWLTYVSDVSGRDEVYVQPYPGPGQAILVSRTGGSNPIWNPVGGELIYIEPRPGEANEWRLMSVGMANEAAPGRPAPLFDFSSTNLLLASCNPSLCYSIAPDGQSFYTLRMLARQTPRVTSIRLVLNWLEEIRRLAPIN